MSEPLEFFPLTKLQTKLLDQHVNLLGFGEGVIKMYHRLRAEYGDRVHPALDENGEVAVNKDEEVNSTVRQELEGTKKKRFLYF